MFFYAGCRCPVCGQLFTENDDIVACPQCGAPHHRSCWQQEGHCHFDDRHRAGFQWEREDAPASASVGQEEDDELEDEEESPSESYRDTAERERRCPRCGFSNLPEALFCSRCGLPLTGGAYRQTGYGEYAPFRAVPINPCGGVDPKEDIGGVPAEELAACVQVNTAYYLPRFFAMSRGGSRVRWNWAAFFCGPYWLLFRKAYLPGGLFWGALALLRTLFTMVTCKNIRPFLGEAATNAEQMTRYMQILTDGTVSETVILLLNLLLFLQFMVHLLCGLFGNWLYMRTTVRRVRRLREQGEGTNRILLSGCGGVSLLLGLLAYSMLSVIQTMVTFLVR